MTMTLSVPLTSNSLILIAQWVETCLEQWLVPASKNFAVNLCCEEAFSNIVKYGVLEAASNEAELQALISLEHQDVQLQLIIEDSCAAFNPLEAAQPAVPSDIAQVPIGGLGIVLMKKFAQKIFYERKDNKNRLFFVFGLSDQAQLIPDGCI